MEGSAAARPGAPSPEVPAAQEDSSSQCQGARAQPRTRSPTQVRQGVLAEHALHIQQAEGLHGKGEN